MQKSEEKYCVEPRADWVRELEVDRLYEQYMKDGSYTHQIINDSQLAFIDGGQSRFLQIGRNLDQIDDVEYYSNINISFDPAYEKITLHQFRVYRAGKWIDKLKNAKITILQREENLDRLIYDGNETLSIIFYDMRTGDLFDYSYTRHGMSPAFGGYYGAKEYVNSRAPSYMTHLYACFDKEAHKNLQIRYHNMEKKLKKESHNSLTGYEYIDKNTKAVDVPKNTPTNYDPWSCVIFSNTPTWGDVKRWAHSIYNKDIYKAGKQINALVQECKEHSHKVDEQIAFAIFFVQEQIRYFADGSNLGGIIPVNPEQALQMRFADCKNKVVILKTILNGLGVQSYPALVSTEDKSLVGEYGPSVSAFNHAIIQIIHNDRIYWFDATFTGQAGDLDHISSPSYELALVIGKDETNELEEMPRDFPDVFIEALQIYDLSTEENTLTIGTKYNDFYADDMRKRLVGRKIKTLEENHTDFYGKRYPNAKLIEPITFTDDKQNNIITVNESFALDNIWEYDEEEDSYTVLFESDEIYYKYRVPEKNRKDVPFEMIYPAKITEKRHIHLPYHYKEDATAKKIDTPYFFFEKKELIGDALQLVRQEYIYRAKKEQLRGKEIEEYRREAKEIYHTYRLWHDDPYDHSTYRTLREKPPVDDAVYVHEEQIYDLREKESTLTVKITYKGYRAYQQRRKLKATTLNELQDLYLEYYRGYWSDIKPSSNLNVVDNDKENIVTITEQYAIPDIQWEQSSGERFILYLPDDTIKTAFSEPDKESRSEPLELKYPSSVVMNRIFKMPKNFKEDDADFSWDCDFFFYKVKRKFDKEKQTLYQTIKYQAKTKEVPVDKLEAYSSDFNAVGDYYCITSERDPYSPREEWSISKTIRYFFIFWFFILLFRRIMS